MDKRNGIATLFSGYNYGSALQAFASKSICSDLGYSSDIIKLKGFSKNRDIRFRKIATIVLKIMLHPSKREMLKAYSKKEIPEQTRQKFSTFYEEKIRPTFISYATLKKRCAKDFYDFFICGSDQIWNTTSLYVDPFYYLRFIDRRKRIAFAPSFGRDFIPDDNLVKIKKYVNDIPYLSIREESGKKLISKYLNKHAEVLVDPTLVMDKDQWKKKLDLVEQKGDRFVLLYFLNEPTTKTKKLISEYCQKHHCKALLVLNRFDGTWYDKFSNKECIHRYL